MTRARTASYGVVTPPPLQLLLQAVLMLCVSLVQGVVTTLKMIFNRTHRDWHTESAHEALPQAASGISHQGPTPPTESFSGSSRESLLADRGDSQTIPSKQTTEMLGSSPSMTPLSLLTPLPVIPDARAACEPEPRGDTYDCHTQLLGPRSRVPRVGNDTVRVSRIARV